MKVLIPVIDNESQKTRIASGFHNALCVCIFDCANETYQWLPTKELVAHAGTLEQELKRKKITTVISLNMPTMALGVFADSGLNVLQASGSDLSANIKKFQNNQLEPITVGSSAKGSACGGSCKSCTTNCN